MVQATIHHGRLEDAARSAVEKLQAFNNGLTPDERAALDLALEQTGIGIDQLVGDSTGYFYTVANGMFATVMQILLTTDWALGNRFSEEP